MNSFLVYSVRRDPFCVFEKTRFLCIFLTLMAQNRVKTTRYEKINLIFVKFEHFCVRMSFFRILLWVLFVYWKLLRFHPLQMVTSTNWRFFAANLFVLICSFQWNKNYSATMSHLCIPAAQSHKTGKKLKKCGKCVRENAHFSDTPSSKFCTFLNFLLVLWLWAAGIHECDVVAM